MYIYMYMFTYIYIYMYIYTVKFFNMRMFEDVAVSILFCVQDVSHNTKVQRERLLENCVNVL